MVIFLDKKGEYVDIDITPAPMSDAEKYKMSMMFNIVQLVLFLASMAAAIYFFMAYRKMRNSPQPVGSFEMPVVSKPSSTPDLN